MEERKVFTKKNFYDKIDSGIAFLIANILPTLVVILATFFVAFFVIICGGNTENLSKESRYIIL